ncbi:MAG: hypothetical protein RL516_1591 [Bacteroidota bacterium]|jgi:uncharacterized protein YndB with AHSA1/START domain
MAKNSKVANKKATKSKVSKAPAKKKPAAKKVVAKKAPAKKVVKKVTMPVAKNKVVVKKVAKTAVTKKVVAKKATPQAVKKVTKPAPKSKVVAKTAKPVAKAVVKKQVPKTIDKPVAKKSAEKPVVKKEVVQATVKQPIDKKAEKVIESKVADNKVKVVAKNAKTVDKQASSKVDTKSKGKPATEEKVEPLQAKAAKAIKELEETMDLSKVRPRLQAGSPPPKPIRHKEPPIKLVEPTNTLKQKYSLEFEFRSSPKILFNTISDASGLAGWFADEVQTKDNIYTFYWDQGSSQAKMVAMQEPRLIRFQWLEDTDGTYFQFEIKEDDITADVALIITDFALKGERETQIRLWESQIQQLKMFVGSL